jgi:hypothetical protein
MENPVIGQDTSFYKYTKSGSFGYLGYWYTMKVENPSLFSILQTTYSRDNGVCIGTHKDAGNNANNMGYGMQYVPYQGYPIMVSPKAQAKGVTYGGCEIRRFVTGTLPTPKKGKMWSTSDFTAPSKVDIRVNNYITISKGSAAHVLNESARVSFSASYADRSRTLLINALKSQYKVDVTSTLRVSHLAAVAMLCYQ